MPISEAVMIDNMEYMSRFPDKFFDLAVVDPPYGINAPKMAATPAQRKHGAKRLNGGAGKLKQRLLNGSDCSWDETPPPPEYWVELRRVSKNQIVWGGNYFPLGPTRCIICWDKKQPWDNFSQVEIAWTSFDGPAQLFCYDNRTGGKIHPTQKPIALYKWIYSRYAKPGMKILDTHLGSGSNRIAAYDMGLDFYSCELDPDYFASQEKRFADHTKQFDLFNNPIETGKMFNPQADLFGADE